MRKKKSVLQPPLSEAALHDAERLGVAKAEIMAAAAEYAGRAKLPVDIVPLEERIDQSRSGMRAGAEASRSTLEGMEPVRIKAGQACLASQWEHDLSREPRRPDVFVTICFTFFLMFVEAVATGAVLTAEGKMSPAAAMMYGVVFALVNVAVAQVAGFFGLRNALYRKRPELDQSDVRKRRRFGWSFFLIACASLGVLVFAAARVRVTGSHHHVFTFEEVGFAATFNDAIALAILAIGVVSSVLNIWKGQSGYADPVPGYGDAWLTAARLDEDAEEAAFAGMDQTEDIAAATLDAAEATASHIERTIAETSDALLQLDFERQQHNADVAGAREREVKRQQTLEAARSQIQGGGDHREADSAIRDFFERLKYPDQNLTGALAEIDDARALSDRIEALIGDVEVECARRITEIEAALSQYRTAAPSLERLNLL